MIFDIELFLRDNGIEYRTNGKNIGRGEYGIRCLKCGEGFHCGINPVKGVFSCWVCGNKGNIAKLVADIKRISYIEALIIINAKSDLRSALDDRRNKKIVTEKNIVNMEFSLPNYTIPFSYDNKIVWQNIAYNYIKNKYDINLYNIINAKLCYCYHGDYKNSIVIPIYFKSKLVNYVTRKWDITNKQRYKNCTNDKALLDIKRTLYNYDNIKMGQDLLVVTEGIFGAIKVGIDRTVATYGIETTEEQLKLIIGLKPKKTIILFDNDSGNKPTWKKANEIANYLSIFINVKTVRIPFADKDPADLSKKEIDKLISI